MFYDFYEANLQIDDLKPCDKIEVWQYTNAPIKSISDLLTSVLEDDKYFWITLMCITHSLSAKITTLSQWKMCFREILFRFNPSWLLHWYTQHTTACNSYVLGTLSSAAPQHSGESGALFGGNYLIFINFIRLLHNIFIT